MMTALDHPLVRDYLRRLREEATRLSLDEANDLVAQISEHLSAALGDEPTEAQVRETLDRLGRPSVVVGAATGPTQDGAHRGPDAARSERQDGVWRQDGAWREVGALVGLVGGAILFWVPVLNLALWIGGLVLLVLSRRWSPSDKLWGGMVLGLGPWLFVAIGAAAFLTVEQTCSTDAAGVTTCTGAGDGSLTALNVILIGLLVGYLGLYLWTLVRLVRRAGADR